MRVEIQLDGQKRMLDTLFAVDRELVKGIRTELSSGARLIRGNARQLAPRGVTGNLRRAIRMKTWRNFLSATVYVDNRIAPHKYLVTTGRKPGTMPPVKQLRAWAKLRGIPERQVFALARAIAQKGTKPSLPFMRMAALWAHSTIFTGVMRAVERVFQTEGGTR